MSGITGYIPDPGTNSAAMPLDRMLVRLSHRGPDDSGFLQWRRDGGMERGRRWSAGGVVDGPVLFHTRLSVLDLSEVGRQPMCTRDGRYAIVLDGTIYNYLELREELRALGHDFRSSSDTEVALAAFAEWGAQALPRFVGMFALAFLDFEQRTLLLARDYFGIKPLYYARTPDGLAFASEVKALHDFPGVSRSIDAQRMYDYLRYGLTDHGEGTLFADVRQLPPAHYAEAELDRPARLEPERYWNLDLVERTDLSFGAAAEQLRALFLDSIRLHLRSDLPVGAALSGGIDSAAIVMSMRHLEPALEIHTFSYIADDVVISEERWVDLVGEAAGAIVHKIRPSPDELERDLEELIHTQDEPFGSTSIYAQHRVFRLARGTGIKVMLDGQGADELLGGYPNFRAARLASLLRQGLWGEAGRFLRRAGKQPGMSPGRLALVAGGLLAPPSVQGRVGALFGDGLVPAWLERRWFDERGVRFAVPRRAYGREVLRNRLHHTVVEANLPMLLRYADRNSMAHSIESRVPFLTPQLANLVLSLPEEYLISPNGTTKSVFRAAMRGIVPDVVLDRRDKIGFATPERSWLLARRDWAESVLSAQAVRRIPALVRGEVMREWQEVLSGQGRFDSRMWRWINVIRWAERFGAEFGAS